MRGMLTLLPAFLLAATAIGAPSTEPVEKRQTTWNPPSNLVQPLNEVWSHYEQTYNGGNPLSFKNYGFDIVMANKGQLNYCVRLDTSRTIDAATRANIQSAVQRHINKWNSWLAGWNGWPYANIPVNVVGYAVRNRNQLTGDLSGLDIYTDTDRDGIPQCAEACGRFFHQNNDYSKCPGGAARHYDMSVWPTDGFGGGAGGDWGQRIDADYFFSTLNGDDYMLLHEMGHTFGLDDFYDWTPTGVSSFVMKAWTALSITDFDGWMLRDWWRHLKSRYGISLADDAGSAAAVEEQSEGGSLNFDDRV
ncbi:hypothetical protein AAF712_013509 [Marasmius tenuissimus]|uniref:Uncharacterized protein n=1 Tax=Marasmius tenuissimus TaxID=585030 RepID=A0ABR2ZEV2_9AGAR